VLSLARTGADGLAVERDLYAEGLTLELANRDMLVPLLTIGDTDASVDRLLEAVVASIERHRRAPRGAGRRKRRLGRRARGRPRPARGVLRPARDGRREPRRRPDRRRDDRPVPARHPGDRPGRGRRATASCGPPRSRGRRHPHGLLRRSDARHDPGSRAALAALR
jgi:hypothetical protein